MRSKILKAFPALFMFLFTSQAYSSFSFDLDTVYAGKHFKDSAGIAGPSFRIEHDFCRSDTASAGIFTGISFSAFYLNPNLSSKDRSYLVIDQALFFFLTNPFVILNSVFPYKLPNTLFHYIVPVGIELERRMTESWNISCSFSSGIAFTRIDTQQEKNSVKLTWDESFNGAGKFRNSFSLPAMADLKFKYYGSENRVAYVSINFGYKVLFYKKDFWDQYNTGIGCGYHF